jgi:hypothetical protein
MGYLMRDGQVITETAGRKDKSATTKADTEVGLVINAAKAWQ